MTDRPIDIPASRIPGLLRGDMTQYRVPLKRPKWAQEKGWPEQIMNEQDLNGSLSWFCKETGCLSLLPVAQPGDRRWVREAWRTTDSLDDMSPKQIAKAATEAGYRGPWCPYLTEIDNTAHNWGDEDRGVPMYGCFSEDAGRLRPSITMPRWASRITLTVTDLAVHRVQDISAKDVEAEGILTPGAPHGWLINCYGPDCPIDPARSCNVHGCWGVREEFSDHWNTTHGPGAWERNDWVLARTFRVDLCNIDQMEEADD